MSRRRVVETVLLVSMRRSHAAHVTARGVKQSPARAKRP